MKVDHTYVNTKDYKEYKGIPLEADYQLYF